jgi:radical SAM superfamily enzyme YgiQ (UPF0313 family)
MRVLLINPPFVEVSTPYPAIASLGGFLRSRGVEVRLEDVGLDVMLRLFSKEGVVHSRQALLLAAGRPEVASDPAVAGFLEQFDQIHRTIDTAVACLQGGDHAALLRGAKPGYFASAEAPKREWAREVYWNLASSERTLGHLTPSQRLRLTQSEKRLRFAFGDRGITDEAVYRASRMVGLVAEAVRRGIDPDFRLNSYAASLPYDLPAFDVVAQRLERAPELMDQFVDESVDLMWQANPSDLVAITIPFMGTLAGAMRVARRIKQIAGPVPIAIGGGLVNTTLRRLDDPDVFKYVDFVALDDGEVPLLRIVEFVEGRKPLSSLVRTFVAPQGHVEFIDAPGDSAAADFDTLAAPTYVGLPLKSYLHYQGGLLGGLTEHPIRWNKLTMAHGCYWKRCTFCDVRLDYIGRYAPSSVDGLLAKVESLIAETGETGFHFVDEAMPPALLRRFAQGLIEREIEMAWWGNVRFDRALADLAPLLARSGCFRLTGGIEVASERILELIAKGITLQDISKVTRALAAAGISVHAYLIYGFPTQTEQETIDALEFVRQLFEAGFVHSVFWHRFKLTEYSPVAADPERFGIAITPRETSRFMNYVLEYTERDGIDHDLFTRGLRQSSEHFRSGDGLTRPLQSWFAHTVPPTTLPHDHVLRLSEMP